ncbi:unnamed protein product [Musa textilis]
MMLIMSQFGFRVGFSNAFSPMVSAVNYFLALRFLWLPAILCFMSSRSLFFRFSRTLARDNNLEFEHERETSKRNSIRRQDLLPILLVVDLRALYFVDKGELVEVCKEISSFSFF